MIGVKKGVGDWESSLWVGVVASGGTGKATGDTLVDVLAGEGSSHLSLKGPVSEKPQFGCGQLGTELLLFSSGQEFHAGPFWAAWALGGH